MQKTHYYKSVIPGFSLDEVIVGQYYDADMQRKIHRFKFVHNRVDRVYFTSLFVQMQEEFPPIGDVIVYPPVSMKDRILRGPNHARFIAQYFLAATSFPLTRGIEEGVENRGLGNGGEGKELKTGGLEMKEIFCPFYKKFFAHHQSQRTKKERQDIQSEILWNENFTEKVRGKHIILVDDLITTGYTAHTLSKLLKSAGAKSVVGYFLASEKI